MARRLSLLARIGLVFAASWASAGLGVVVAALVIATVAAERDEARAETERRVAERTEALARDRQRLAEAQRLAQVGSWERDGDGKTLAWSEELSRIHGLSPGVFPADFDA